MVRDWFIARLKRQTSLIIARRLHLREYGTAIASDKRISRLTVPGQDDNTYLPIDLAFIPLRMTRSAGLAGAPNDKLDSPLEERALIIGEPGSGKSSLLKREVYNMAQDLRSRKNDSKVPVLVSLAHVAASSATGMELDLLQICMEHAMEVGPPELGEIWDDLLKLGRIAVYLDGLDEVPFSQVDQFDVAIATLSRRLRTEHPANTLAVSARPQVISVLSNRNGAMIGELQDRREINRFTVSDIYEFLTRWPQLTSMDGPASPEQLFARITNSPHLAQLCRTPLLLAMYTAIAWRSADPYDLPSTRLEFYDRSISELVLRRRRTDLPPSSVRMNRWQRFAEEVAIVHLLESDDARNHVSRDTLDKAIERYCAAFDPPQDPLSDFVVNTGLLRQERRGETYVFMHLSFAEYLAAVGLARRGYQAPELAEILAPSDSLGSLDSSRKAILTLLCPQLRDQERRELLGLVGETWGDEVVLLAYMESMDYSAVDFQVRLARVRERIVNSPDEAERLRLLLILGDLWQQVRLAVEEGQLALTFDLSVDLRSAIRDANDSERRWLIRMIARSDEITAWNAMTGLGIRVEDYPEDLSSLLAVPAILGNYIAVCRTSAPEDSQLQWRLGLLLEACLRSRRVAELVSLEPPIFPLGRAKRSSLSLLLPPAMQGTLLSDIVDQRSTVVATDDPRMLLSFVEVFANVRVRTPRLRAVVDSRWVFLIPMISLVLFARVIWIQGPLGGDWSLSSATYLGAIVLNWTILFRFVYVTHRGRRAVSQFLVEALSSEMSPVHETYQSAFDAPLIEPQLASGMERYAVRRYIKIFFPGLDHFGLFVQRSVTAGFGLTRNPGVQDRGRST